MPALELDLQIKEKRPPRSANFRGLDRGDIGSVVDRRVARRSVASEISGLLDSSEVAALIRDLDALRWTGRKGYGARALVGACLVKSLYAIPTWTRVAGLIAEHAALRDALGGAPSHWSMYRFATKLR